MSDEQIAEYLRSRASVRPPMDLVASIGDAIQAVPQRRHSWFAPFVPAAAAVAAAAVVLVAAVLVGQGPDAGPPPGSSPTEVPATPTSEPSPSPTSVPALLEPGDSVTIDAVDPNGRWGSVTLTRGEDVGGYDDGSVADDGFVIEIHVEYTAEREPDPFLFGAPDWTVATLGRLTVGEQLSPGGQRELARPVLATYPGAIDIFDTPLEGWLLIVVPREAADEPLDLLYRHTSIAEAAAVIPIRAAGTPPDPVAGGGPEPVTYVEKEGYPFTVVDNAEADELFATPDTCTNPEAGYTITYPDDWFTNTEIDDVPAIGDWPACSWFSPTFFDLPEDSTSVPPQVAIIVTVHDTSFGFFCEPNATVNELVTVAGFEASRLEHSGCPDPQGGPEPAPMFSRYVYTVIVAPQPAEVPTLRAQTYFAGAADYELNRAVLDRIMALIEFDE